MTILVTGGAGYIGSHTCVELLTAGHELVVYDNFCNSDPGVLERIEKICGRKVPVVQGDIRNESSVRAALRTHGCDAVIHFAALKAVGESVEQPLRYYDNNVHGALCLLRAMEAEGCKRIVFSSSATVYGEPQTLPIVESHPLSATNPYGRSKLIVEEILRDLFRSNPTWSIVMLRYFNPVGAHPSGLIGESPRGIPNNLMPYIARVAAGTLKNVTVWGSDYPTPDGTGVRDYIHVVDLARGHLKALEILSQPICREINLGTGKGYSVLEVIRAFEQASGRQVPFELGPRRPGDVPTCFADPALAERLLGWKASSGLAEMCASHWLWQSQNPTGYA